MLTDERRHIRNLGFLRIIKSRTLENTKKIRSFYIPKFNFESTDYIDLVDWQEITNTSESPLTRDISENVMKSYRGFRSVQNTM